VGQLAIRRPTENLVIHYFVVDEWQGEPVECVLESTRSFVHC
jgi:hypothetical protein